MTTTKVEKTEEQKAEEQRKRTKTIILHGVVTDKYELSRFVNGKMKRAIIRDNLQQAVVNGFGDHLTYKYPEGTTILIHTMIELPSPEDEDKELEKLSGSGKTEEIPNSTDTPGEITT